MEAGSRSQPKLASSQRLSIVLPFSYPLFLPQNLLPPFPPFPSTFLSLPFSLSLFLIFFLPPFPLSLCLPVSHYFPPLRLMSSSKRLFLSLNRWHAHMHTCIHTKIHPRNLHFAYNAKTRKFARNEPNNTCMYVCMYGWIERWWRC